MSDRSPSSSAMNCPIQLYSESPTNSESSMTASIHQTLTAAQADSTAADQGMSGTVTPPNTEGGEPMSYPASALASPIKGEINSLPTHCPTHECD